MMLTGALPVTLLIIIGIVSFYVRYYRCHERCGKLRYNDERQIHCEVMRVQTASYASYFFKLD
jgi:hypothetical protein